VNHLLEKKCGLMKKFFENPRDQRGAKDTILEIKIIE